MDRGQIFIGERIKVDSYKNLNNELKKYDHKWNPREREVIGTNGKETKYRLFWNSETDPIADGCIFGIEVTSAYVNRRENTAEKIRGSDRDWIQEISLEKLAEELLIVRQDIPDAKIYLIDLHY